MIGFSNMQQDIIYSKFRSAINGGLRHARDAGCIRKTSLYLLERKQTKIGTVGQMCAFTKILKSLLIASVVKIYNATVLHLC